MYRSLLPVVAAPQIHHRLMIEALFGVKCNDVDDSFLESEESVEWTWDKALLNDFVDLMNNDRDVKFHRNFSSGTAVVRGTHSMSNDQYFWEVKMISPVYGTDMMIGIGTPDADISQVHDKFVSLLGMDNHTWGLSYTGLFHHNGESRDYSSRFGQGSVIGVHLDMWNGTLSFYKNKKHLGVTTKGLKGKTFYAMASSTAACSGMRIVRSCSFPSSLQFLCCSRLRELIPDEKNVLSAINIPPGLRLFLKSNLSWLMGPRYYEAIDNEASIKRSRWTVKDGHDLDELDFAVTVNVTKDTESGASKNADLNENLAANEIHLDETCYGCLRNALCDSSEESCSHVVGHATYCTEGPNRSEELDVSLEDHCDSEATEAKRRCCSYNYVMGLSDPDSD